MNKIPMSSLAITLRTKYCYPAIELRPTKIFVPPQPKNRVTINYPTYLRPTYVIRRPTRRLHVLLKCASL